MKKNNIGYSYFIVNSKLSQKKENKNKNGKNKRKKTDI